MFLQIKIITNLKDFRENKFLYTLLLIYHCNNFVISLYNGHNLITDIPAEQ